MPDDWKVRDIERAGVAAEQRLSVAIAGAERRLAVLLDRIAAEEARLQFGPGQQVLGIVPLLENIALVNPTAAVLSDIVGATSALRFDVQAGVTYRYRFFIFYDLQPDLTASAVWSVTGPTATQIVFRHESSKTGNSRVDAETNESWDATSYSAGTASSSGNIAVLEGMALPSVSGQIVGRMGMSLNGYTLTVKKGSYVEYGAIA